MKTYYTIISAAIRPEIQEQVTVGLLLVAGKQIFFSYSARKMNAAKAIMDKTHYAFLKEQLAAIDQEAKQFHADGLLDIGQPDARFGIGYLSYLSRYSNGLVCFSAPSEIDMPGGQELYSRLFAKYIDAEGVLPKKNKDIEAVKKALFERVKPYYDLQREISPRDMPLLPMSVTVDLAGKNEIPVFSKLIDFDRNQNLVDHDLLSMAIISKSIENGRAKLFIVGNEPDAKHRGSHESWRQMTEYKAFTWKPLDQASDIEEYAREHGVIPFFQNN